MPLLELVFLALALSMDAFAVTAANVVSHWDSPWRKLLLMPLFYGFFQGLMPCLGYFSGSLAAGVIERYAGIVAFLILGFIGGRMVWGSLRELGPVALGEAGAAASGGGDAGAGGAGDVASGGGDAGGRPSANGGNLAAHASTAQAAGLTIPALLLEAIATSIDAFVVGISFLALHINVLSASILIACTTAGCCLVALAVGRRFGAMLGKRAELIGGLVLVAIGIKALIS